MTGFEGEITKIGVETAIEVGKRAWKKWQPWRDKDPITYLQETLKPSKNNKVDIISYTSETMYYPISIILEKISRQLKENEKKVEIRLLFRDCKAKFLIRPEQSVENEIYNEDVLNRALVAAQAWIELKNDNPDTIDLQLKIYPFEPLLKGVLINSSMGYFGLYTVGQHQKEILTKDEIWRITAWDYLGKDTKLIAISDSGNPQEKQLAKQLGNFFEKLWKCQPLTDTFPPKSK